MCNLYSLTTNQAAYPRAVPVINRYVGNLLPMPGVFPDYPAPVIRNTDTRREMVLMRWACRHRRAQTAPRSRTFAILIAALAHVAKAGEPMLGPGQPLR